MEQNIEILKELNDISKVVANLPRKNTFSVPPTYFEHLPDIFLALIKESTISVNTSSLFAIPQNYFNSLSENILQKIKQQENSVYNELEEIAPSLNTLSKDNLYSVPPGYFNAFIIQPVNLQAKIVPFKIKRNNNWVRYAVAASITAIIATVAYFGLNNDKSPQIANTDNILTINNELQQNFSNISDAEIDSYFNGEEINTLEAAVSLVEDDTNVEAVLKTMSKEEIEVYLKETQELSEKALQGI